MNARVSAQEGTGDINMVRFLKMKWEFHCMNIVLHYKREIERPEVSGETAEYNWVQKRNLHEIGLHIVMECVKNGEKKVALRLSELSLKTVHVFALAMRGVLLARMRDFPSEVEQAALGSDGGCRKGDVISLMIDRETSKGVPTKNTRIPCGKIQDDGTGSLTNGSARREARRKKTASTRLGGEAEVWVDCIHDDELLQCG